MHDFGRLLQLLGLILLPIALLYYFLNQGQETESKLMFGELSIFAVGVLIFLVGRRLEKP